VNLSRLLRWSMVPMASALGMGAGLFLTNMAVFFMESGLICPDQFARTSDVQSCNWPPIYTLPVIMVGCAFTAMLTVILGSVTAPHPKRNLPYWIFAAGAAVATYFLVQMFIGDAYIVTVALATYSAGFLTAYYLARRYRTK
jgi:hypothetical protein